MKKVEIVVAAHEIRVESDDANVSLQDVADLALGLFRDTEIDARKSPVGFEVGGTSSSTERAQPYQPQDGEWGRW